MAKEPRGWTVTVTAAGPRATRFDFDAIAEWLVQYSGVAAVTTDGRRVSITLSFEGIVEAAAATRAALRVYARGIEKFGLPDWPVIRVEAMTWAEQDRELAEPAFPELAGVAEIAEMLDVSSQRVSAMRRTHAGFPAPIAELRSGPVWVRDNLRVFAEQWARRPGRPARVDA